MCAVQVARDDDPEQAPGAVPVHDEEQEEENERVQVPGEEETEVGGGKCAKKEEKNEVAVFPYNILTLAPKFFLDFFYRINCSIFL